MRNQIRVLLVDDEPLVLEMFESVLARDGYEVETATSSTEALQKIQGAHFDAGVFDVMMEQHDGFDLLVSARSKNPQMAVILITGAPSETDAERARVRGAAYLAKPIGFDELLNTVSEQVEHALVTKRKIVHG